MARQTEAQRIESANELAALELFHEKLRALPDPRRAQGLRYPLQLVVVTGLMAMVCGADDAQAMEYWSESREKWLSSFLDAPHGMPSQDVYLAVFAALDPEKFSGVLREWAELLSSSLAGCRRHIAIDGKTSRRSFDTASDKKAIHTVSAWLSERGLVLGAVKTAEKSNEITAIPELLNKLDIRKAVITIDAMGCQTKIAKSIVEGGGDYLLSVKDNQPALHAEIQETFREVEESKEEAAPRPLDERAGPVVETYVDVDKGHGRLETRTTSVCKDLRYLIDSHPRWAGLSFIVQVKRERLVLLSGKSSIEHAYFIGSRVDGSAKDVGHDIRQHWAIENSLHYVLDMAFREDEARHRVENCAQNMTTMRHFALNMIKNYPKRKRGVKNTRMAAGWDQKLLIDLLTASHS